MSYLVLARKYRPQTFGELVGQEVVANTLKNAVLGDRVPHAWLFSGPRGVGKTSTARILARALNCPNASGADPCNTCVLCQDIAHGRDLDVLEIDGASNRRVQEVERLREQVKLRTARARFKIYIIDEVHMLSIASFNALLKTLEEPPDHVKFVLATTEPHKVLETIVSRCTHLEFRRIGPAAIAGRLAQVVEAEGLQAEPAALQLIARKARGGMRDALSMLDQAVALSAEGAIEEQAVRDGLGVAGEETIHKLLQAIGQGHSAEVLRLVDQVYQRGWDTDEFLDDVIEGYRALMLLWAKAGSQVLASTWWSKERLQELARHIDQSHTFYALQLLAATKQRSKWLPDHRVLLELALLRLAELGPVPSMGQLALRLARVEERLGGGGSSAPPASAGPGPRAPAPPKPPARPGPAAPPTGRKGGPADSPPRQRPQPGPQGSGVAPPGPLPPGVRPPAAGPAPSIGQVASGPSPPPAAPRRPQPTGGPAPPPATPATLQQRWGQLVDSFQGSSMAGHLKNGRPLGLQGGELHVGFPFEIQKKQVEEELGAVRAAVERLFGPDTRLILEVSGGAPEQERADRRPTRMEASRDPLVRKAQQLFEGTLVRVERCPEPADEEDEGDTADS